VALKTLVECYMLSKNVVEVVMLSKNVVELVMSSRNVVEVVMLSRSYQPPVPGQTRHALRGIPACGPETTWRLAYMDSGEGLISSERVTM
jgi:hypothetical protein